MFHSTIIEPDPAWIALEALIKIASAGSNRPADTSSGNFPTRWLSQEARRILERRRRRSKFLPASLLGEPGWDILLGLIAEDPDRIGVCTKVACLASGVPMSTALRYLQHLVAEGLVTAIDDTGDKRRRLVNISQAGVDAVCRALQLPQN